MLTDEQREIRALARQFADGEIRPRAPEWDEDRALDDDLFRELAELGFLGMLVPEEHGGLGLDILTYLLAVEELSWGDATVGLAVSVQNGLVAGTLLRHGSDEQKERLLPRLASGEAVGAFALSEAGAGSDLRGIEARAAPDGDGWRLDGRKKWVTNGGRADVVVVFARAGTEPDAPITAFVVERPVDGYEVVGFEKTMGLRASETVEVRLDDVPVGPHDVVGEVGSGLRCALEAMNLGRAGVAALSVGVAQAALEHAAEYAGGRVQFGRSIAEFGGVQEKLADLATRIAGARSLTHEAARELESWRMGEANPGVGTPSGIGSRVAMAKLLASETAIHAADEAVQIYGGYGYMRDYPVEKLLRDAKGTEIFEGTSEIMRLVVARDLMTEVGDG